jgi:hypothetical protein
MNILHKIGLTTIKSHNASVQRSVDEMNKYVNVELEKRSLLVDETLMEFAKWQFDTGDLQSDRLGVKVILDVPRSLIVGLAHAEPDIAGFTLTRVTYLLKSAIQKALNQIASQSYSVGGDQGSYL